MLLAESTRLLSLLGVKPPGRQHNHHSRPPFVEVGEMDVFGSNKTTPRSSSLHEIWSRNVVRPGEKTHRGQSRHCNHLKPIEWCFLADGGGVHAPKIGGFKSSTFLRKNSPSAILLPTRFTSSRGRNRNRKAKRDRKHCTDCEHDLTSPIVNSTRRGSVSAKETRHGQVLCSKMWLFVSCAIQIVSDSNNTTISSASLTRDLKSDELGVNDPQAISASVTGPEDVS